MRNPIELAFEYFRNNQTDLFAKYPNKYLVIADDRVVAATDSMDEAVRYTIDNHMSPGTFMIQHCSEGDGAFTQTYHSRVVFA